MPLNILIYKKVSLRSKLACAIFHYFNFLLFKLEQKIGNFKNQKRFSNYQKQGKLNGNHKNFKF